MADNDELSTQSEEFTSSDSSTGYFDDDEEMLAGDDKVVFENEERAAFMQLENSVFWEIKGLYNDDGELKNKYTLRHNPPELVVKSSDGEQESYASFFLTPEVARSLNSALSTTYKAQYGIKENKPSAFSQESFKQKIASIVEWVKEHPIKTGLIAVIIIFVVYIGFFQG